MADKFGDLELVREYPNWFLNKTKALKVYRTKNQDKSGRTTSYRWHFGFPEELVKPFCPLLETTPFWGEQHWKEVDGYWLWWLMLTTEDKEKFPIDGLNQWNNFYRSKLGEVIDFYNRSKDKGNNEGKG